MSCVVLLYHYFFLKSRCGFLVIKTLINNDVMWAGMRVTFSRCGLSHLCILVLLSSIFAEILLLGR